MVVTEFRTGGGAGGAGVLEDEPELEDELLEDELEDDDEVVVEVEVAVVSAEKVETVSSPLLTTKTLFVELSSAYEGMMPTIDCEIAVSPETSIVVLSPACAVPFWVRTTATLLRLGLGCVGIIGVATGR
jgi:hypothetical protein